MNTGRPLPPSVTAAFLIAESILYLAFLALELAGLALPATLLKDLSILGCLSFSLTAAFFSGDRLVTLAMAFTALADCFLLVAGDHLMLGVLLFLFTQTVYLIRLRLMGAPQAIRLRGGLALLAALVLYALKLATPLNLLAGLYFSQLLSNTLLAWTAPSRRLAIGLILFVGCDICVGLANSTLLSGDLYRFVSLGMWLFYLPSQVLIVLSALPKEVSHEEK